MYTTNDHISTCHTHVPSLLGLAYDVEPLLGNRFHERRQPFRPTLVHLTRDAVHTSTVAVLVLKDQPKLQPIGGVVRAATVERGVVQHERHNLARIHDRMMAVDGETVGFARFQIIHPLDSLHLAKVLLP